MVFLNHSLNLKKNLLKPLEVLLKFVGLRIREHKAGVKESATKAEISTDTAIVIANC